MITSVQMNRVPGKNNQEKLQGMACHLSSIPVELELLQMPRDLKHQLEALVGLIGGQRQNGALHPMRSKILRTETCCQAHELLWQRCSKRGRYIHLIYQHSKMQAVHFS